MLIRFLPHCGLRILPMPFVTFIELIRMGRMVAKRGQVHVYVCACYSSSFIFALHLAIQCHCAFAPLMCLQRSFTNRPTIQPIHLILHEMYLVDGTVLVHVECFCFPWKWRFNSWISVCVCVCERVSVYAWHAPFEWFR